jgi:hypothetical protein
MGVIFGLAVFFGLGALGAGTFYWAVRHARTVGEIVFFGFFGTALLVAQCFIVKFAADFGAAFGGDYASGFVLGWIAFSVIAVALFIVAAISRFSNRN